MPQTTITIRHDPTYVGEARMSTEDGVRVLTFGAKDPTSSAPSIVALLRDLADLDA